MSTADEDTINNGKNALRDIELLKATAQQVIKDFKLHDIEIKLSENTENAYQELLDQVYPAIEELITFHNSTFLQLLYQVDVSEKELSELSEGVSHETYSREVCELILNREFKKVISRYYFQNRQLPI